MVQCWSAGLEIQMSPVQTQCGKKKIFHRSNQNNTTTNPSAPELNTCNCQRWKPEAQHCAVVECRTRDPEVHSSKPAVGKKKICQRSNQNNTTINPSAPELNTWYCLRWKTRSHCHGAVVECRTRDPEIPSSNPGVGKNKIPHRSNQNITTTNPLHQS